MAGLDAASNKIVLFARFERSLSNFQRQFLLQNPDLISPDVVGALFRTSLDGTPHERKKTLDSVDPPVTKIHSQHATKKARKVVNSWMAFRSYYSRLIKDLPQKARSPMLALLWKHDLNHGIWELLSAAFSHIRDNYASDEVSLDDFLSVAAQVVPIVPPSQYLERYGWIRKGDVLERSEVEIAQSPTPTNTSCSGLIRYCFRKGLISMPSAEVQESYQILGSQKTRYSSISFAATTSALDETQKPGGCQGSAIRLQPLTNVGMDFLYRELAQGDEVANLPTRHCFEPNYYAHMTGWRIAQDSGESHQVLLSSLGVGEGDILNPLSISSGEHLGI